MRRAKEKKGKKEKKVSYIKLIIVIAVCVIIYTQIYSLVMFTLGKKDSNYIYNLITTFINNKSLNKTEDFNVNLLSLGSVYANTNIIKSHRSGNSYDFTTGYSELKNITSKYDIVLASLETPIAGSNLGYSTKTVYNAPNELTEFFKYLNISSVACANSNMLDKNEKGVLNTIDILKTSNIKYTGINESSDIKPIILEKNNIKIGVLSYSNTTDVKIPNKKEYLVNILSEENIKRDVKFLEENNVDYIVSYLYTANVDSHRVNSIQKNLVNLLIDNKVNVIIGTGSKVVQEDVNEIVSVNEEQRHVYYIYSVGDLLGDMTTEERKSNIGVDITFTKSITKDKKGNIIDSDTKKNMTVNNPVLLYNNVNTSYKVINYPIDLTLENYKKDNSTIDKKTYDKIVSSKSELEKILIKKEGK